MIKYKGITSNLLSDLSLELGNAVNLSQSEHMLLQFFQWLVQDLNTEKKVELICRLPIHLKPFCTGINAQKKTTAALVSLHASHKTCKRILTVLKKYTPEDAFILMCSCLPETTPLKSSTLNEKVFLVA